MPVAKRCSEIIDVRSVSNGKAGEVGEKWRVCPLAARVGCDASEVQDRLCRVLVDGQVVRDEARGSSKRITGCGEPGVDRRQSTRWLNTPPLASRSPRCPAERFVDAVVGEKGGVSAAAHSDGVTGVLLVGGGSRRFGSPKALARIGEKTFADIAWDRLAWCDERLACGKLDDGLTLRFPVRDDDSCVRAPRRGSSPVCVPPASM